MNSFKFASTLPPFFSKFLQQNAAYSCNFLEFKMIWRLNLGLKVDFKWDHFIYTQDIMMRSR